MSTSTVADDLVAELRDAFVDAVTVLREVRVEIGSLANEVAELTEAVRELACDDDSDIDDSRIEED